MTESEVQPPPVRNWAAGFQNVDAATAPEHLVAYLDMVAAMDAARAYKPRSFALLHLRAGSAVLDAGCGTGDDARALAQLVGPTGTVVGVDSSETMIEQARARAAGENLPVDFVRQDIHRLDFASEAFDGCRADRVLQHVEDPLQALAELVRVAKRGGRVVACEPDWDTLAIDAPDREVTRAIVHAKCDAVRNGWIGRQLYRLFGDAGLVEVTVEPAFFGITNLEAADVGAGLKETLTSVAEAIGPERAAAWWESLEAAARAGRFFAGLTALLVAGRNP